MSTAGIEISPDDLARGVDAECKGADGGRGIVESGVGATAVQEAVDAAGVVGVLPDNLAKTVDTKCSGAGGGRGIVDWSVDTVGEEEGVLDATVVDVPAGDLAYAVDAFWEGLVVGRGMVDGGIGAAAKEEAVVGAGVRDIPDNLTRIVDGISKGANGGGGIVEGGVNVDRHVVAFLVAYGSLSFSTSVIRGGQAIRTGRYPNESFDPG